MAKFMLLFRGGAVVDRALSPVIREMEREKWGTWTETLKSSGNYLAGGVPLSIDGTIVRTVYREVSPGFPADSQLVTGTYFLHADSLVAATELAKRCPILDLDGSVEIRFVLERPK